MERPWRDAVAHDSLRRPVANPPSRMQWSVERLVDVRGIKRPADAAVERGELGALEKGSSLPLPRQGARCRWSG